MKETFWQGFNVKQASHMKRHFEEMFPSLFKGAEGSLTGGGGHSAVGKGTMTGQLESDSRQGNVGGDMVDKTLLDRDRNPRDFSPFQNGEELQVESNPHIRY